MRSATHAKGEPAGRIKAENVVVAGVLMPCEYVSNAAGRVRVLMLADVELDDSRVRVRWHRTLHGAAEFAFEHIESCRKLSVLITSDRVAKPAFRQVLKRDLPVMATDASIDRKAPRATQHKATSAQSPRAPDTPGLR